MRGTYRSGHLDVDFGHTDEGFVEVLDGLGSIFGRLVADITNTTSGKIFHVRDWEFPKMLPNVIFGKLGRETAHEDAGGLHV